MFESRVRGACVHACGARCVLSVRRSCAQKLCTASCLCDARLSPAKTAVVHSSRGQAYRSAPARPSRGSQPPCAQAERLVTRPGEAYGSGFKRKLRFYGALVLQAKKGAVFRTKKPAFPCQDKSDRVVGCLLASGRGRMALMDSSTPRKGGRLSCSDAVPVFSKTPPFLAVLQGTTRSTGRGTCPRRSVSALSSAAPAASRPTPSTPRRQRDTAQPAGHLLMDPPPSSEPSHPPPSPDPISAAAAAAEPHTNTFRTPPLTQNPTPCVLSTQGASRSSTPAPSARSPSTEVKPAPARVSPQSQRPQSQSQFLSRLSLACVSPCVLQASTTS